MSASNLRSEVQKVNELADAVLVVSKAMKEIRSGKLTESALLVLIQHACGGPAAISQKQIKLVMKGIENMSKIYVKG